MASCRYVACKERNQEVDIRQEAGRIVGKPVREKKYKLDDLLKGIAQDNIHAQIDFGRPQGDEVWWWLALRIKSFDWRARKTVRKGKASAAELAKVRAKLRALIA